MNEGPTRGAGAAGVPVTTRRRAVLLGTAGVVVAALVALGVVLAVGGGDAGRGGTPDAAVGASSAESPASPSAAEPAADTAQPAPAAVDPAAQPVPADELPATLPAVALSESVVVEEVRGSLVSIDAIDARATGPGNVDGPALRVTVRVENETDAAISLDEVSVNLFFGADNTPASPVEDSSQRLFMGSLPAGEAGEATYVFRVPPEQRDAVTVQVGYRAGAPIAVFAGSVR